MERSTFNKQYNYRLVLISDNIDLKHCGNCIHLNGIKGFIEIDGCFLMKQCGISPENIKVNNRRSVCDLWQRKDND
jgi:hypothetical protein